MAIEFARVRYIKRSNGGNVCRSAAYNQRSDLRCERTGELFYFAHRDGALHHEILLPDGAAAKFADAAVLWNAAQAVEHRKDSQEAREVLLALPSDPEMGLEHWKEMAAEFAREHFVSKGLAVQVDIHAPHDGEVNVHAHFLVTTRRIEGDRFAAHKARDLDPQVRTLQGGRHAVTEGDRWGVLWRDYQNLYFERQGLELRVDETGPVAQTHEGPVRMRTVPGDADARLAETRAQNEAAVRDPAWILAKLTERQATFTWQDIDRLTRKHIPDIGERAAIREAVLAQPQVVPLHERENSAFIGRYTTEEVRAEERDVLAAAGRIGVARQGILDTRIQAIARESGLDTEQEVAFLKATGTDGLVVIEGLAGTGKSHTINAVREAHERAGWRVVGLAPTNVAAEGLRRSGFTHGSTVHLELFWQDQGRLDRAPKWDRRTAVIVDEAAMMDTPLYGRLMRRAAETGAKVILTGDDRQLSSVTRGGMFTAIKETYGSAVIGKVRRQEQEWQRAASENFAGGRVAEGLRAYAERGHIHWSGDIDESRARLLSDWDQESRERPEINRFVYASTNAEVDRLNRAIRDIRVRRGEIPGTPAAGALEVETVRGKLSIASGDRIQFHGNDRKAGIYNGSLATVQEIENGIVTARTDAGGAVRFDTAEFNQFGLGYAGTVYRGQGKTQTEVYAIYDNSFAWNVRTAYVGLTRHTTSVELYVSRDLAPDEIALGKQMARRTHDEPSLKWATRAEIIELGKRRDGREGRGKSEGAAGAPAVDVTESETPSQDKTRTEPEKERVSQVREPEKFPRERVEALRQIDLTVYARDVHGYAVRPRQQSGEYSLQREREDGQIDVLHVRQAQDGHWTFVNAADPKDRGDIFDLAKREGAPNLQAAREAVEAYNRAMPDFDERRRKAEEKLRPDFDKDEPHLDKAERDAKQAGADAERARDIAGAAYEDQREAAGYDEEQRQAFARTEADRIDRLNREAAEARDIEQRQLERVAQDRPLGHDAYLEQRQEQVVEARTSAVDVPKEDVIAKEQATPGIPASAQLRYTEALAQHYDPRDPYASLAKASLVEAAGHMRDRQELDQRIAAERDPARRDSLILRRDIEHHDHQAQAYGRIAGLAQATGAPEAGQYQERAQGFRDRAQEARKTWRERGSDQPDLYPPLNPQFDRQQDRAKEAPVQQPERTLQQEREAMKRLDLPDYAARNHGYQVEWSNQEQSRATLTKSGEIVRASRGKDGAWSYDSQTTINDRGDILDFVARRGARTTAAAREQVRPELERVEKERGRLDPTPRREREGQNRSQSRDDGDGPERDPTRRKGRER